jgi:hypothetical protein
MTCPSLTVTILVERQNFTGIMLSVISVPPSFANIAAYPILMVEPLPETRRPDCYICPSPDRFSS